MVTNKRFAVTAKSRVDFHRPVPKGLDLRTVFCIEEERHVNNDWTVRCHNRYSQILYGERPTCLCVARRQVAQYPATPLVS